MQTKSLRVLIVGGGIGGLCLAHALRAHGLQPVVYDRDPDAATTDGYRLHLSPEAHQALANSLPPALYQALLASAAGFAPRPVAVDTHLRKLLTMPRPRDLSTTVNTDLFIGRVPLRRLLAHDLDGHLRFGKTFTHYTQESDGRVTAHFTDGSHASGDLLVGADGAGSRVSAQRLPAAAARPTGVVSIGGRVQLTKQVRAMLPDDLVPGPMFVLAPQTRSLFLTVHDPTAGTVLDGSRRLPVAPIVEDGYVVWGLMARQTSYPSDPAGLDGKRLRQAALELTTGWDPRVGTLIRAAEPGSVTAFTLHAPPAYLEGSIPTWPASNVTLIGDAVHPMPPTGGVGASTAIRDADTLARQLARVWDGEVELTVGVRAYEDAMRDYGFAAVRASMRTLGQLSKLDHPIRYLAATKLGFPVAQRLSRIRPRRRR